jgi:hypothetical protein
MAKKTCPRCEKRVRESAGRCRGCGYAFPEKSSPWAAGPAYGVGFPLVLMGVFTIFIIGLSWELVLVAGGLILVGTLFFMHPR